MTKLSIILPLISSFFIVISFLPLAYSNTKVTHVRVYVHDTFSTSQPPVYTDVLAFQDPLTVGPDPNSTSLGRLHAIVGFPSADATLTDAYLSTVFIFTSGTYNGSTLVVVGRNDVSQSVRNLPIVGGTGCFQLARGIARASTYSSAPTIYKYDFDIFQENDILEMIEMKYV